MYLGHLADQLRLAEISVPRDRFREVADLLIVEFTNGSSPKAVGVADKPNPGFEPLLLDGRPKTFSDVLHLGLLRKEAGRHATVLVGVHFILWGYRIDLDTVGLISLKELYDVIRIWLQIAAANGPTEHGIVVLHPARRTPG